ncbi:hypothetical protein BBK82_07605 [Lentzea guizhouensis]|uniref:Uncharacterized protein n=1 Tax=Lentzea guizhouensis TaxID=1586287 RepID=A0A1B2HE60_9PSEU|nr:hypothetical protein BBK82_07605 [Lentzea guizhouensis]
MLAETGGRDPALSSLPAQPGLLDRKDHGGLAGGVQQLCPRLGEFLRSGRYLRDTHLVYSYFV